MKLEISEKVEPVVRLCLAKDGDNVELKAITSDGIDWHIITVMSDGTIQLHSSVPKDIGFNVQKGYVKTIKE